MLKMKEQHLTTIQHGIARLLAGAPLLIEDYENGKFSNAGRTKNLNKRFRWDCLHSVMSSKDVCNTLYPYLDDTHIDSALRHVMTEMKIFLSRNF
mgnify:CR=1 FL=1